MKMIYYRHKTTGDVWALEDDIDDVWILPDLEAISDQEVSAHLSLSLADSERSKRDSLLFELDSVVLNPLRWAALDAEQQAEAASYRQALLDVPQQSGFPDRIDWPDVPAFID